MSKKNSVAVKRRRMKTFQEERKCYSNSDSLAFPSTIVLACHPYFSDSNTNNSIIRNCVEVWKRWIFAAIVGRLAMHEYLHNGGFFLFFFNMNSLSSSFIPPFFFSYLSIIFLIITQSFFELFARQICVSYCKINKVFFIPFNYLSHCFTQSSSNYSIARFVYLQN